VDPGAADIIGNARDLVPTVRTRADEIAAGRRLPDDLVAALRDAGVFRMPMPRAWGGPEMTPAEQTEVVEILSAADPSTGWCVMIGSDAGFYSAFLHDEPAKELFDDLDTITAGWLVPAGRAEAVDGGYRVSGRWSFGSSCLHADVMVGGCLVYDGDELRMGPNGLPAWRVAAAPAGRWQVLDTWHTTGLAGSGSNDYLTDDLFVPEEHTFSLVEPPVRAGPLYAFPGMFFANTAGVPLGLARRAIDEVKAIAEEKVIMPEMVAMRDVPRVRGNVARAEMALGASRAFTYRTLDAVWARLQDHDDLDTGLRIDLALSRVHAFRTAREVAQLMVDTVGTQAIFATSPLDRLLRDAITMSQHIVAQERMAEMVGGMALGADSPYPFV
jgi:indole-3-acetate monooxygenase